MKKTLLALALMSAAMSANASKVTGIPAYDLTSSAPFTFNTTVTTQSQFFAFGTTSSTVTSFLLNFVRGTGSSSFAIFQDTDGVLDTNADWANSNNPLLTFRLNSLNVAQTITLAAGNYVLRLNGSANPSGTSVASLSAVPLPAAAWLFGSALFGAGLLRRKNNNLAIA